jgi:hypothetical protein
MEASREFDVAISLELPSPAGNVRPAVRAVYVFALGDDLGGDQEEQVVGLRNRALFEETMLKLGNVTICQPHCAHEPRFGLLTPGDLALRSAQDPAKEATFQRAHPGGDFDRKTFPVAFLPEERRLWRPLIWDRSVPVDDCYDRRGVSAPSCGRRFHLAETTSTVSVDEGGARLLPTCRQ